MTELRRSSRVRQSAKHASTYYIPDEKNSLFSTPGVRPRGWRTADVAAGYFTVKRWVPRDQQHLTAGLHGGLTDPAEIAAAKQALRANSKVSTRFKSRNRMGSGARLSTLRRSSGSVQDNSSFGGAAGGGSSWGAGRGSDAGTGGGGGSAAGSGVSGVDPSPAASPSPPPAAAPAAAPSGDRYRARSGGDREAPFSGGMFGVDDDGRTVGESDDGSNRAGEGSGGGEDDGSGGGRKRQAAAMKPGSEDVGEPPLQSRRISPGEKPSRSQRKGNGRQEETAPSSGVSPSQSTTPDCPPPAREGESEGDDNGKGKGGRSQDVSMSSSLSHAPEQREEVESAVIVAVGPKQSVGAGGAADDSATVVGDGDGGRCSAGASTGAKTAVVQQPWGVCDR
ncbi:unnamed protein product [Ectocarpus sp. 12 AP-2014]